MLKQTLTRLTPRCIWVVLQKLPQLIDTHVSQVLNKLEKMREMLTWMCGQGAANSIRLCGKHSANTQAIRLESVLQRKICSQSY